MSACVEQEISSPGTAARTAATTTICSSVTGTAGWSAPVYAPFIAHWIIGPSPSQVAVAEPRGRDREQRGGHGTEHREVPGVDAVAQRLVALVVVEQGQVLQPVRDDRREPVDEIHHDGDCRGPPGRDR